MEMGKRAEGERVITAEGKIGEYSIRRPCRSAKRNSGLEMNTRGQKCFSISGMHLVNGDKSD